MDYTAFATIPAAFSFCRSLGGHQAIRDYNHDLILQGASLCARHWGTELLVGPTEMISAMADVILPATDALKVKAMVDALQDRYNTFIVTKQWLLADNSTVWITRLSAQIYLEIADFETLAIRVLELLKN